MLLLLCNSTAHIVYFITGLQQLQQPSGAFQATKERSECDMRFLYCACAISSTLGDWTGQLASVWHVTLSVSLSLSFCFVFILCACLCYVVCAGVNIDRAEQYIFDCITYEGGISLIPGTILQ